MTIVTLRTREWIPASTLPLGLIAGAAWALTMGLGFPFKTFVNCGVICRLDVAVTTAVSVVAGFAVIGPLAAFRRAPGHD